jgi:beta-lactam-binding protein with PASTA domain
VPNVVGMNHQAAQDLLQASGFYVLLEQDATGQGRPLVIDRNWEVVTQSVPAGTTAPLDTPITLSSKKIGE